MRLKYKMKKIVIRKKGKDKKVNKELINSYTGRMKS